MGWWLESAKCLFLFSKILKSQDKLSDDDINNLKDLLADYINLWTTKHEEYIKIKYFGSCIFCCVS